MQTFLHTHIQLIRKSSNNSDLCGGDKQLQLTVEVKKYRRHPNFQTTVHRSPKTKCIFQTGYLNCDVFMTQTLKLHVRMTNTTRGSLCSPWRVNPYKPGLSPCCRYWYLRGTGGVSQMVLQGRGEVLHKFGKGGSGISIFENWPWFSKFSKNFVHLSPHAVGPA